MHKDSRLALSMTANDKIRTLSEHMSALRCELPWRHPSSVSALVWIFCGAGNALNWQDGRLVDDPAAEPDQPYLAPDAIEALGAGRAPPPLSTRLAELLPTPGSIVPSMHSRDFNPPSSLPAARIPFEADAQHIAGSIVACKIMLACAPLLIEPAGTPRGRLRTLLRTSLNAACLIASGRACEEAVASEAGKLLERPEAQSFSATDFAEPALSGED